MNPLVKANEREQKRRERNERQRARRSTPEAKAREVAANRKSRIKRKLQAEGLNGWVCVGASLCSLCERARAAGLPQHVPVKRDGA